MKISMTKVLCLTSVLFASASTFAQSAGIVSPAIAPIMRQKFEDPRPKLDLSEFGLDEYCPSEGLVTDPLFTFELAKSCTQEYETNKYPRGEAAKLARDQKVCECERRNHSLVEEGLEKNKAIATNYGHDLGSLHRYNERIDANIVQSVNALAYNEAFVNPRKDNPGNSRLRSNIDFLAKSDTFIEPVKAYIRDGLAQTVIERGGSPKEEKSSLDYYSSFEFPDLSIDLDAPASDNVCVTPREFYDFNQFPTESSFYDSLAKMDSFNEADWSFDALINQHEELSLKASKSQADKTKMEEIKSRLLFLNKNPLIKNVFNASSNFDVLNKIGYSDEIKNQVMQAFEGIDLLGSKKNLFNIVKNLKASTENCSQRHRYSCLEDVMKQESAEEYKKQLQFFFSDSESPVNSAIALSESFKALYGDLDRTLNPKEEPFSQPLTYSHLQNAFSSRWGSLPNDCRRQENHYNAKCDEMFQRYCPMVLGVANAQGNSYPSLRDELFYDNLNYWNPDIELNPGYKNFNDRHCLAKRKTHNRAGAPGMTFSTFRKQYCRSSENACGPNTSLTQIRDLFHAQYPYPDQADDPEEEASLSATFHKNNNISSSLPTYRSSRSSSFPPVNSLASVFSSSTGNRSQNSLNDETVIPKNSGALAPNRSTAPDDTTSVAGTNFFPSMLPQPQQEFIKNVSEQETTSASDRDMIRQLAQEEVSRMRASDQAERSAADKTANDSRIQMLEQLLSQKTESENKYQELINQLSSRMEAAEAANKTATTQASSLASGDEGQQINRRNGQASSEQTDQNTNRGPANYNPEMQFMNAGASASTAPTGVTAPLSSASIGSAASSFNTALLEAQEARAGKVQRTSDGAIILASDVNSPLLQSLSNAANPASDYSLSVPAGDYAGFEVQSMDTLKRYQEKFLQDMDSNRPVRVLVRAENKSPLEFFVVRDGERLFFKPVRKTGATLEALKQAVKKSP